jgi:hypothetical protein
MLIALTGASLKAYQTLLEIQKNAKKKRKTLTGRLNASTGKTTGRTVEKLTDQPLSILISSYTNCSQKETFCTKGTNQQCLQRVSTEKRNTSER